MPSAKPFSLEESKICCLGKSFRKPNLDMFLFLFSEHFHIFVGDLSSDIETHQLKGAFQVFGEIS